MENGLSFFSSPPRPTPNLWQHSATTFYTPQQDTKLNWTSAFAPTSPSPLRTSRNANLMSSPPLPGGKISGKNVTPDEADENTLNISPQLPETPFSIPPSEHTSVFPTTFSFDTTPKDTSLPTAQEHATSFQFSAQARSSSPSALLQSHMKNNRDSRKRLFLDRLKSKRDDARSDRAGDQVLRMDFMRERKKWEEEKARSDTRWEVDIDVDADTDEMVDEEMSPTEEKEIEELTSGYYERDAGLRQGEVGSGNFSIVGEDFEDDGYDELFMEVLSQEPISLDLDHSNHAAGNIGSFVSSADHVQQNAHSVDSDMDMS